MRPSPDRHLVRRGGPPRGRRGGRRAGRCRSRRPPSRARRARPSCGPCAAAGSSSRTSSSGSSGVPASASASPAASRAATGANRSRPWNVAETGSSRHGEVEISTASTTPPKRSAAGMQQAVVGADEQAVVERGAQRDGAAPRADLRVDDREVHAGRRVGEGAREHQRAGEDGLARDAVGEVDDARGRALVRDHGVHDADELVRQPVVGEEGDRPRHVPSFSRRPAPRPPARRACGGRPRGRARGRGRAARRWWRARSRRAAGRSSALAPAAASRWRTVEAEVNVT